MLISTELQDGFHNLAYEQYHSIDAVRHSWLEALRRSPAACRLAIEGDATVETKSLRVGRALHAAVLEPLGFADEYFKWEYKGNTKEGKKEREVALKEGRTGLTALEWGAVIGMAESIKTHPIVANLLNLATHTERVVLWHKLNRLCKARIDIQGETWVTDIKSTRSLARFSPSAVDGYGYHRQAGWYTQGIESVGGTVEHFYFVAVANSPPYESAVFRLDQESLDTGRLEALDGLGEFIKCEESGIWTRHMKLLRVAKSYPPREEETDKSWQ